MKKLVFAIIRVRVVNILLRILIRPFLPILPDRTVSRIPFVGKISIRLPNMEIFTLVSDGSDSIASLLYWNGLQGYEPETVEIYLRLLKHCRVIFDIGANTGLFTLLAGVVDRGREVHAFEPEPRAFKSLQKNIEINGLRNAKAIPAAVTDHDGEISLHVPRSICVPVMASVSQDFMKATDAVDVEAITLDSYASANNIAGVDLVKIDVEGAEHKVLQGARKILDRDKPVIISEVLGDLTKVHLEAFFRDTEYSFFHITEKGLIRRKEILGDKTLTQRNYLFIPTDKIPELLEGMDVKY